MSEFVVPHTIRGEEATPQTLADIDDNFRALCRALGALSSGGAAAGHDIISATHLDSSGTPTAGAVIIRDGSNFWTVLPVGTDGFYMRVVAGFPTWASMGLPPGTWGDASNIPVITVDADGNITNISSVGAVVGLHDLLSGTHPDTTTASPLLGDLIVGEQDVSNDIDDGLYWADGEAYHGISTTNDAGTLLYWTDGEAMPELVAATALGPVTWRRKAKGSEGQVLSMVAGRPQWAASTAATGTGVRVYQSANFSAAWGAITTISFNTIERDDAGYFSLGSPTRITVPVAGWYSFVATATATYATIGLFWLMFYVNGTRRNTTNPGTQNTSSGWGGEYEPHMAPALIYLNAGDYVEFKVISSRLSGAATTMIGGAEFCNLAMVKVG